MDEEVEHYDEDNITTVNGRRGDDITNRALKWLEADRAEPTFLFLNYFDAHQPFVAPPDFVKRFLPGGRPRNPAQPSPEEISSEMDLPVEKVRKVLKIAKEPISLETPAG